MIKMSDILTEMLQYSLLIACFYCFCVFMTLLSDLLCLNVYVCVFIVAYSLIFVKHLGYSYFLEVDR